jgi:dTDP-4-dehydrorhamnose 3,5-epimerase
MGEVLIEGVEFTKLTRIEVPGGDVLHAMKSTDHGFSGFGEAYFSIILAGLIKGWKRHRYMTLNLVVPQGRVRFVFYDDRPDSSSNGLFHEVVVSPENYLRITVAPMLWVAFQGVDDESLILNIADICHDPVEVERRDLLDIQYEWVGYL